jgi:hypothetical protein
LELEFIGSLSHFLVSDGDFQVQFGGQFRDSFLGLLDFVLKLFQAGVAFALELVDELVVLVLLFLEVGFDVLKHFYEVFYGALSGELELNSVQDGLSEFCLLHSAENFKIALVVLFSSKSAD